MNPTTQYVVEILLKAREQVVSIVQKAEKALDGLNQSQETGAQASDKAAKASKDQAKAVDLLKEAHVREKRALDDLIKARAKHSEITDAATKAQRSFNQAEQAWLAAGPAKEQQARKRLSDRNDELDQLRELQAESKRRVDALNDEVAAEREAQRVQSSRAGTAGLRGQLESQRALADSLRDTATAHRQAAAAADENARSAASDARSTQSQVASLRAQAVEHTHVAEQYERESNRQSKAAESVAREITRTGHASDDASVKLNRLGASLQGFQIAFVIKYAQSLVSGLAGLAGIFLSVASAAGVAGATLAGAFVAGVAEALPVVGLLGAALVRVAGVVKAVALAQQNALSSTRDAEQASIAQAAAAEQVRSAEEAVAEANRRVTDAQEGVNQARKQAVLDLEDLIDAERRARDAQEKSVLSYEEAQAALRRAISQGDVAGAARAEIGVREARGDQGAARTAATRATQAASTGRRQGVDDSPRVVAAERQLADARRSLADATHQLDNAQDAAARSADKQTAAQDRLKAMLDQMSRGQRLLYVQLLSFEKLFSDKDSPITKITDIIVGAFARALGAVQRLILNNRILASFRALAVQVSKAIDVITGDAGKQRNIGFITEFTDAAARDLPLVTKIFLELFHTLRNVAEAALPAVRLLLHYIDGYASSAEKATDKSAGLKAFFIDGVRYVKAFGDAIFATIGLFLALGDAGKKSGLASVNDYTASVRRATTYVHEHREEVEKFFDQARDATKSIASVILTFGKELVRAFSSGSVKTFADFLDAVVLPAIGNAVVIMGQLTSAFHALLSLPFVSEFAQFAVTVLLLTKGFLILKEASIAIAAIGEAFFALNPIVATIIAIVAAIVLLDRRFHFIQPTVDAVTGFFKREWPKARDAAVGALRAIGNAISALPRIFRSEISLIRQALGAFVDMIGDFVNLVKAIFGNSFVRAIVVAITAPFVTALRLMMVILKAGIALIWPIIKGFVTGLADSFDNIKTVMLTPFRGALIVMRTIFRVIGGVVRVFTDLLRGDFRSAGRDIKGIFVDLWDGIKDIFTNGFDGVKALFETFWDVFKHTIRGGIGGIRSAFNAVTDGISAVFKRGFEAIVNDVVFAAINKMIDGVNKVTQLPGLKEVIPGGKIKHLEPIELAQGAMIRARPGGILANIGEAGHDEVVLSSDPRHAERTRGLLDTFLSRAPHVMQRFAEGGYVQGAIAPPGGHPILQLIKYLTSKGYDVTSAFRPNGGPTVTGGRSFHNSGDAADFGNSVNNLPALWSLIFPLRRYFAELFGPTPLSGGKGYYNGTAKDISGTKLQAIHENHIHVAMLKTIAKLGSLLPRGVIANNTGAGLEAAMMSPALALASGDFGAFFTKNFGANPAKDEKAGIFRNLLGTMYGGIKSVVHDGVEGAVSGVSAAKKATGVSGSLLDTARHAAYLNHVPWVESIVKLLLSKESGGRNLGPTGRLSATGPFQVIPSTFAAHAWPGHHNISNVYDNALAAFNYIRERYHTLEELVRKTGLSGSAYVGYAAGGAVPGFGGGDRHPALLEGGEHVWTKDEVQAIGGHSVLRAMRRMLGGGGQGSGGRYEVGGAVPAGTFSLTGGGDALTRTRSVASSFVDYLVSTITGVVSDLAKDEKKRTATLGTKIRRAMEKLTEDGGLLDNVRAAAEAATRRSGLLLTALQFRVSGGQFVRGSATPADLLRVQRGALLDDRRNLQSERGTQTDALGSATAALDAASRITNKKRRSAAVAAAEGAVKNIQARLDANQDAMAANLQAIVEKQEELQQAVADAVNNAATKATTALDRAQRLAVALGRKLDPVAIDQQKIAILQQQQDGLERVLANAASTGNTALADATRDQIEEIKTSVAEATADIFNQRIQAVNDAASGALATNDLQSRMAQIGGTNYGLLGQALTGRGSILQQQRAGLVGLLGEASASGNVDQADALSRSIQELDVSIAENTQAVQDNTDAAFASRVDAVNKTFGFTSGVNSGVQGFYQALAGLTGVQNTPALVASAQAQGQALNTQRTGLTGLLAQLLGYNPSETAGLQGLQGAGLVSYLQSISSGPAYDSITSGMDEAQRQHFQDLVTALIGNSQATVENTQSVKELTGSTTTQSFNSAMWQRFRSAVFDGNGGLLPRYQTAVSAGSAVSSADAFYSGSIGQSGPVTRTNTSSAQSEGDTYNTYITQPTEVLDEANVGRRIAFARKGSRARG